MNKPRAEVDKGLRTGLFRSLTGLRGADVSGNPGGDIKGMLLAVGGSSKRTKSGIDLTAAANRLGVSRRTVERWVRNAETGRGQRPNPVHAKQLAALARKTVSTKAGRRRIAKMITDRLADSRVKVTLYGVQGPSDPGTQFNALGYPESETLKPRLRASYVILPPEDVSSMVSSWVQGGEKGFRDWAEQQCDGPGRDVNYLEGWKIFDLHDVDITSEGPQ